MQTEDAGEASFPRSGEPLERLSPDRGWQDVVLPKPQIEMIRTVCAAFRERGPTSPGLSAAESNGHSTRLIALFVGEPGTGKTTATRVLGRELGLGILRLDLAQLASGDPEEAESALAHALSMTSASGEILYLDKAEALFARRQPPVLERSRRRAQVPVDVLVGQLDSHSGLIVLAAQLKARLDDQVLQRLDYEVDFPFPQTDARERIWRLRLPGDAQIDEGTFRFLAGSFKLSGAAISRAATFAQAEATAAGVPVDMRHLVLALEREYGDRLMGVQTRAAIARMRELAGLEPSTVREPALEPQPLAEPEPQPEPIIEPEPRSEPAAPTVLTWPRPKPPVVPEPLPPVDSTPEPEPAPAPKGSARPEPTRTRQPAKKTAAPPASANRRLAQLTVGGVLIAALLGFLLSRAVTGSGSSVPRLDQRASAGLLRASYPAGWRRETPPATPALGLTDELALAPSGSGGLLVVGRTTSTDPSVLLPASLISATGHLGPAQRTTLNGAQYYRYLNQSVRGLSGLASLYVLPAGAGTIFGLCEKQGSDRTFAGTCERVVGTVRPVSGGLLRVSLSPSYASGLTAAMAKFSAARATASTALARARSPKAQAAGAAALSAAYSQAANAVATLNAGGAGAANLAIAAALRKAGDAYRSLGRAAANNDARGYNAARSTVSAAVTSLGTALAQLGRVGYVAG